MTTLAIAMTGIKLDFRTLGGTQGPSAALPIARGSWRSLILSTGCEPRQRVIRERKRFGSSPCADKTVVDISRCSDCGVGSLPCQALIFSNIRPETSTTTRHLPSHLAGKGEQIWSFNFLSLGTQKASPKSHEGKKRV